MTVALSIVYHNEHRLLERFRNLVFRNYSKV